MFFFRSWTKEMQTNVNITDSTFVIRSASIVPLFTFLSSILFTRSHFLTPIIAIIGRHCAYCFTLKILSLCGLYWKKLVNWISSTQYSLWSAVCCHLADDYNMICISLIIIICLKPYAYVIFLKTTRVSRWIL